MQPNAEMSYCHVGFDLKAAREICIKLDLRYPARSLVDIDYQCALAAEMLPAALDEIERQDKRIAELEEALVEERAQMIYPFNMSRWENVPEDDEWADHPLFGKARQTGKNTYRWHAREQLRREGKL